jgi:hypothetical protein
MSRTRNARFGGIFVACSFGGLGLWSGCSPTPLVPTIEIDQGSTAIYSTFVASGLAFGAGAPDLGPVPTTSLLEGAHAVSVRLTQPTTPVVFHTVETASSTVPGPIITLANQPTLYTYIRDPDEQFTTLTKLSSASRPPGYPPGVLFNSVGFAEQERYPPPFPQPWMLPYAITITLPTTTSTDTTRLSPAVAPDYWLTDCGTMGTCSPKLWEGAAAEPSSIKAIRLDYPGLCSFAEPLGALLPSIASQISALFFSVAAEPGLTAGEMKYLQAASVVPLHAASALDANAPGTVMPPDGGGFVLQGEPTLYDEGICNSMAPLCSLCGPFPTSPFCIFCTFDLIHCDPCAVQASYYYQFELSDGFLTVNPVQVAEQFDDTLTLCTTATTLPGFSTPQTLPEAVATALDTFVPKAVLATSMLQQRFSPDVSCGVVPPGGTVPQPDDSICQALAAENGLGGYTTCDPVTLICHDAWDCTINTPGAAGGPPSTIETECGEGGIMSPMFQLEAAIGIGAEVLADSALDVNSLQDTIKDIHNWECTPEFATSCGGPPPTSSPGRCHFLLRAKRITVDPSTVRLVWFDDLSDVTQPGLALFVATFGTGGPSGAPDFSTYSTLCNNGPNILPPP